MTREDVIALARDAAFYTPVMEGELMRFADLVAKAERKRIYETLIKMHTQEERHNNFLFIANIIKEST